MLSNLYKFFILRFIFLLFIGVNFISIKAHCNQKILLFGDSLMAGYGLDEKFHLSTVLEKNLREKGFNIKIINASVSGDTTLGGLNRLNWVLREKNIDIVILCLGANDMLRGIQPVETKKNLEQIIEIAKRKEIEIILAGMIAPTTHGTTYKKVF